MGYKSDVGVVLSQDGHEALKSLLNTLGRSADAKALRSFLASAAIRRVETKSKSAVWLWKNVNWNEDVSPCPAVFLLAQLLRSLPLEAYRFVRLGEYLDDAEDHGKFQESPFRLRIAREIVIG
ncbi:MAG: hypothetical protein IJB53_01430 [Mailhella sp.]|nr:hypothetical protein [Mailhella sp.]